MLVMSPSDAFGHGAWFEIGLLGRLALAAVLGGVVGIERELSGKAAGFRTNMLICVGAALFTHLSQYIAANNQPLLSAADPTRIAAQIVSGIGFLGAGTIIQSRGSVVGLTTAATLWVVAAIGMAVGGGEYIEAVGATVLVIVVLILLGRVEMHFLRTRSVQQTLRITLEARPELVERIERMMTEAGFHIEQSQVEKGTETWSASFSATASTRAWKRTVAAILAVPGVSMVSRG